MNNGKSNIIRTLLKTELLMLMRDRRTVFMSIVLPLIVMPIMMFGSHWITERRTKKIVTSEYSFAVQGDSLDYIRNVIRSARATYDSIHTDNPLRIREIEADSPVDSLASSALDFIVVFTDSTGNLESPVLSDTTSGAESGSDTMTSEILEGPLFTLKFRADREKSRIGMERIGEAFRLVREDSQYTMLRERGFSIDPVEMISTEEKNIASTEQVAGLRIGRLAALFFLLFMISGGAVVANDTIAGEKERGTLETLLTSAASRTHIIIAKHLAIFIVGIGIATIQSLNLLIYVALKLIPLPENMVFEISPGTVFMVLLFMLPVAAVVSGILLLVSAYAKSYKEAQLYFFPVFLFSMVPAVVPLFPGVSLRSIIAIIPVANIALAVKEMMVGQFDWLMLAVSWLVTMGTAIWIIRTAERTLSTEHLIVPGIEDEGIHYNKRELFKRQVLPVFAILWVLFFILSMNTEGKLDLRVQLALNLIVLFLGASLVMIRRYRLDPVSTLQLRLPRIFVWPLVIIGAPAALIVVSALAQLVNHVIPMPSEYLKSLEQYLIPEHIPVWQLVFFTSILPGVVEEITFRGVLLRGLRDRFGPGTTVIVSGLIFAAFHVALFRLVPTAFLGMVLAFVTIMTGSIYPAMLWHALNNGISLFLGSYIESVMDIGTWGYIAGFLILGGVLILLARTRGPRSLWSDSSGKSVDY